MKKNLLVSFSGGETSGFMVKWLIDNKSSDYNMAFVFANTGEENKETLEFIDNCDKEFKLNLVWVEAVVFNEYRVGTSHKIVNFKSASRKGEPFEDVIGKYGIPNQSFPHCNRELKLRPIHSYIKKELGWSDYYTAISIRYDEIDRMVADRSTYNIIYPLIESIKMTKEKINFFWSTQSFRLKLKSYQGNCKTCWKKSKKNLSKIASDNPEHFEFFKDMENKYSLITPLNRDVILDANGNPAPARFFRDNLTVDKILELGKNFNKIVRDASENINFQLDLFDDDESCDIFSGCGDL